MATKSHFKIINQSVANADSALVLVGTALDGPSHVPFTLNDLYASEDIIGRSPLSKAYKAARKTGISKIILYRLNGEYATGKLTYEGDTQVDVMSFRSIAASSIYNEIKIDCGPEKITVTNTNGTTRHYFFSSYPSSNVLVDAINLDAEFGLIEFTAAVLTDAFEMDAFDDEHAVTALLEGGSEEANLIPNRGGGGDISSVIASLKGRLNEALFGGDIDDQESYLPNSALAELEYGVICLVDMYHDDGADFTNILGRFCMSKSTDLNNGSIGVIGVKPIFVVTDQAVANKYISLLGSAPTNSPAGAVEVGVDNVTSVASPYSYVQIVVGDIFPTTVFTETPEPISMAYPYAALQAYLPSSISMTNKGFGGLSQVNYEFSKENIDSLLANGYISIVSSIRRGVVPYQAITGIGNKSNSLLKNPSVVRVSHAVTRRITEYLDSFIGETSTPISRRTLDSGLYNALKALVEQDKLIRDYELQVDYFDYSTQVSVKVSYVPLAYIDKVSTTVDMPFNREVIL